MTASRWNLIRIVSACEVGDLSRQAPQTSFSQKPFNASRAKMEKTIANREPVKMKMGTHGDAFSLARI